MLTGFETPVLATHSRWSELRGVGWQMHDCNSRWSELRDVGWQMRDCNSRWSELWTRAVRSAGAGRGIGMDSGADGAAG